MLEGSSAQSRASIGVVLCEPGHGCDGDALLEAADAALWQARQLGRDRYLFADECSAQPEDQA